MSVQNSMMKETDLSLMEQQIRLKYHNKILAICEVMLAYISIIGMMWMAELMPEFESWQRAFLGRPLLSSIISMALPIVLLVYWHGHGRAGSKWEAKLVFAGKRMKDSLGIGVKALAIMFPVTFAFPIAEMVGLSYTDWGGAGTIASFYMIAILGLLWLFKDKRVSEEKGFSSGDARISGVVMIIALFLTGLFHALYPPVADVIVALVFVGFLEELLFRGYMQPRLNLAFEKRFNFSNLQFGWGLILTSALFGLIHVVSPGENPMQWAWGLWTCVAGFGFCVIREKSGSFIASAIVHGFTMILPLIFS